MKKWNPYILPPDKEEGPWKRVLRLGLVITALIIFLLINKYGINFHIDFQFQSYPEVETSDDDSRRTALQTGETWLTHEYSLLVIPTLPTTTQTHLNS